MPLRRPPARRATSIATMTTAACTTITLATGASAQPADCGATPVLGRDGVVLYWTGGTDCGDLALAADDGEGSGPQDRAPVTRNSADAGPALTPETRPVMDPVSISG